MRERNAGVRINNNIILPIIFLFLFEDGTMAFSKPSYIPLLQLGRVED